MISKQSITIDLSNPHISPVPIVYAKQGDSKSRVISATITDNGSIINITAPYKVYFGGIKGNSDCYITGFMNTGTIDFAIPQSALLESGRVPVEIQIFDDYDSLNVIATMTFSIIVKPCVSSLSAEKGTNSEIDRLMNKTITTVTTLVEKIPDKIFMNCTKMTYFRGENIKEIDASAFQGCSSLINIKLSPDVDIVPRTLHIPSGITVKSLAFAGCTSFNKLIVDDYVTFDGDSQFSLCGFNNVTLPGDITELKFGMFKYLPAKVLDLPASVVSIGEHCLHYSKVEKLIIWHTSKVITMKHQNALWESSISQGKGYIYVPDTLYEDYKVADNWKEYSSQFKKLSEI